MKKRKLLNKEIIIKTRKLQNVRIINNFNPFLNLTIKVILIVNDFEKKILFIARIIIRFYF